MWNQFGASEPLKVKDISKAAVSTRRVLTRKMADGKRRGGARLVARGYQHPDLKEGAVDTSGRVSLRPSPVRLISLGAIEKWRICSLDIKNTFCERMARVVMSCETGPHEWPSYSEVECSGGHSPVIGEVFFGLR